MAQGEPILGELLGDVASHGTGLNTGHAIRRIDPENPVQSAQVHRHDRALLLGWAAQCVRHVGAAAVGDEADVVAASGLDEGLHLLLLRGVDDQVRYTRETAVFDGIHLLLGVAVAVTEADLRLLGELILREELAYLVCEGRVYARLRDRWRVVGRIQVVGPHVGMDRAPHPRQQIHHFLAAQRVAISHEFNDAVRPGPEAGVAKTPDVRALLVAGVGPERFGTDEFRLVHDLLLTALWMGQPAHAPPGLWLGSYFHASAVVRAPTNYGAAQTCAKPRWMTRATRARTPRTATSKDKRSNATCNPYQS